MSRRERMRARRRVERTMDEAWEAVQAGKLRVAARLSRRARDAGSVNPRILLDHGRIMMMCEEWTEAEDSLRASIAAAPTYGEAFATLAELQSARGKLSQAVRLQERAVELLPADEPAARALERYRAALAPGPDMQSEQAGGDAEPEEAPGGEATAAEHSGPIESFDWEEIAGEARRRGAVLLRDLLTPAQCDALHDLYDGDDCDREVDWNDETEGRYAYRHLLPPLPPAVQGLRDELYRKAAVLANAWEVSLERRPRYPRALAAYLSRSGGHRSSPRLLRLPGGGWLAPRREVRRRAFPFQVLVDLGAGDGGELALDDRRPGKKLRRHVVATRQGDAVLHCVQDRLVRIAGIDGLQPVLWSFANTSKSERLVLQLPFQDD